MRRSTLITDILLPLGVLVTVTGFLFVVLRVSTPQIYDVRYTNAAVTNKEAELPLQFDSNGKDVTVTMIMKAGALRSTRFRVWPDDCVEVLEVNGERAILPPDPCYGSDGHLVSLGTLLETGDNILAFDILDHGGKGGLNMQVSATDPLRILLFLIFIGTLTWAGMRLSRGITGRSRMWLLPIVVLAVALRFLLINHPGFGSDIGINIGWARSAALYGLGESYSRQVDGNMLPNYPPLSMIVFAGIGYVYKFFFLPTLDSNLPVTLPLIKVPAMLMDVMLIAFFWWFIRRLRSERAANIAALTVALHPVILHNGVVWGQTDILYGAAMCFALYAAMRKKWFWAGALTAMALLFKMQAIVVLPVMGLMSLSEIKKSWWRFPLGALLMTALVLLPFIPGGGLPRIWEVYSGSAGFYKNLTLEANNIWMALYGTDTGREDTRLMFDLIPYRNVGFALFFSSVALLIGLFGRSAVRGMRWPKYYGFFPFILTGLIACAFFLFNTEMHERYMVVAIPLLLPMIFLSRRAAWLYAFTSLAYALNLMQVVQFGWVDRAIVQEFTTYRQTVSVLQVLLFVLNILELLRIQRHLDQEQTHWMRGFAKDTWQKTKVFARKWD